MPKPGKLADIKGYLESYYRAAHAKMGRAENLYLGRFEGSIALPENVEVFKSSRAAVIVDDFRAQVRIDEPTVIARPFGSSTKAKDLAALQEMWGHYVLRHLGDDYGYDPLAQVPFDLCLMGAACIKFMVRPEVLAGRPADPDELKRWKKDNQGRFPFIVTPVDPRRVLMSPGPGHYAIEVQRRSALSMWEHYPHWSDPKRDLDRGRANDPNRTVEWIEYWSWYPDESGEWMGWYIVEADGERIIEEPNPYGCVPYIWQYSGLGRLDYHAAPESMAVGILDSIIGELEADVLLKTALLAAAQFHVFPRLIVEGMSAKEGARLFMKGPGAVIERPPQGAIEWLAQAPPNQQMLDFLGLVEQALQRKAPPVLSGQRTADYGIHEALLAGQSVKGLMPIRAATNRVASILLDRLADLVERFDIDMTVLGVLGDAERERTIRAHDLRRHQFEVRFEAIDPAENDRRMLAGLAVYRAGLISRETFHDTYLKGAIESHEEEEQRILAERIVEMAIQSGVPLQAFLAELQSLREQSGLEAAAEAVRSRIQNQAATAARTVAGRERGLESLIGTGEQVPVEPTVEGQGPVSPGAY